MNTESVRSTTISKLFVLPLLALLGCGPGPESEEVAGEILMALPSGGTSGGSGGAGGGGGAAARYMNRPPAVQSSTAFDGHPGRASDRNTDGNYHNGSVSHTDYEVNPFWQTLTTPENPESITIYNRTDCCKDRLSTFMLWFWRERHRAWIETGPFDMAGRDRVTVFVPANNGWGAIDAVRIVKVGEGYLSLAEVVVTGR